MKFGTVAVSEAEGGIAAHSVRMGDLVIKKGTRIGAAEIEKLMAAGVENLVIAQLASDDVGEDAAAMQLATVACGKGVRVERAATGRSNLYAEHAGVLLIDVEAVNRFNAVDEAVTLATLPAYKPVTEGEMIATVKIIPFAIPGALVDTAIRALGTEHTLTVAPFRPLKVAVISTVLPGLKPSVIKKTQDVLAARLALARASICSHRQVKHDEALLARALSDHLQADHLQADHLQVSEDARADLIIVFGASAITDRRDVIPAALERAGGRIEHFGMPVDPGNLLLFGELNGVPVLGAPGCARSPKENGFDWVLQRILANVPITRADIMAMGVGGLLMEIVQRGLPRDLHTVDPNP